MCVLEFIRTKLKGVQADSFLNLSDIKIIHTEKYVVQIHLWQDNLHRIYCLRFSTSLPKWPDAFRGALMTHL